jgi:hypothetical protein
MITPAGDGDPLPPVRTYSLRFRIVALGLVGFIIGSLIGLVFLVRPAALEPTSPLAAAAFTSTVGGISGALAGAAAPMLDQVWKHAVLGSVIGAMAYGGWGSLFASVPLVESLITGLVAGAVGGIGWTVLHRTR